MHLQITYPEKNAVEYACEELLSNWHYYLKSMQKG